MEFRIRTPRRLRRAAGASILLPSHLESHVRTTFFEIQRAWTAQDLPALQKLLDPTLFAEWKAQIEMLQSQGGRNVMEDLALDQARIIEVKNFRDDDQDSFTEAISTARSSPASMRRTPWAHTKAVSASRALAA